MEAGWEVGVAPWLQRPMLLSKDMEPLQARTTWRRSHLASPRRSKLSNGRGETCSARCPRAGTLVSVVLDRPQCTARTCPESRQTL